MSDREFERALNDWLESGSDRTPPQAIDAVLLAAKTTPQERDLRLPWRTQHMNMPLRVAAGIAIVAILGFAALQFGAGVNVGTSPTPTPTIVPSPSPSVTAARTPTPTVNLDTASWTTFVSERYGYTIKYPPAWEAEPGSRGWALDVDGTDWVSPAQDEFIDNEATYQIGVHGFQVRLNGTPSDEWIDSYLEGVSHDCVIPAADMPEITVGGWVGKLADQPACADSIAFFNLDRGHFYVFTIGRANQLPLFEAFLSTVVFTPSGGQPCCAPDPSTSP